MRRITRRDFLVRAEAFVKRYEEERLGTCPGNDNFRYSNEFKHPERKRGQMDRSKAVYKSACYWCMKLFSNPEEIEELRAVLCPCGTFSSDKGLAMAHARKVIDNLKGGGK